MDISRDVEAIANLAEQVLSLDSATLCEDYYYQSLPLCIINAVFSINTRYKAVQNVIYRYCNYFKLKRIRDNWQKFPSTETQESVTSLCDKYDEYGISTFADNIYQNHQRTSPRNGILKAEAVQQFAFVFRDYSIEYFQDVQNAMENTDLKSAILSIKGQRSGISLRYLWMLAGSDDLIKPDRMILRFLRSALTREADTDEAQDLLTNTAHLLQSKFPQLTPRLLDYEIWCYETA